LFSFDLRAQFTGADASQFPNIRVFGGGPIFNNARTSDFTVLENGQNMNASVSVQCSTAVNDPSVNAVLIIDISASMNEKMSNGRTKLEWVKNGARNFINSLIFNGTTQACIITFNGNSYTHIGWQNTALPLLTAIDTIQDGIGATIYDNPLIDPRNSAVALLRNTPTWIRRLVVFLTDGAPNQPPQVNSIVNQLNQLRATLYSIALSYETSPSLRAIAEGTGGRTFVANQENILVDIYKQLGSDRPTTTYCWLNYRAPYGCDEASRNRNIQITFRPTSLRQNFSYTAPAQSLAQIQNSVISLPPFPDVPAGQSATQQYTITAKNTDITVTGFSSTLSQNFRISSWGGAAPPFQLLKDSSRTITVEFTQTSPRDVRSGQISINGIPCSSPPISVSGGSRKVVLITPNGGEILNACDSVLITWGGIDAIDTVRLQYSLNGGSTWNLISDSASGLSMMWKAPRDGSYLIRVAARTTRKGNFYTGWLSGSGLDTAGGIATARDASSFAVTGSYDRQLALNGTQISSTRTAETFLGLFRDGKTAWLRTGAQLFPQLTPYTSAAGRAVAIDSVGNIYSLHEMVRAVNGGRRSLILARHSQTGGTDWTKEILGVRQSLSGICIAFDSATRQPYLIGIYNGQLRITLKNGQPKDIIAAQNRPFTLFFNQDGDFLDIADSLTRPQIAADTSYDEIGNIYTITTFRGRKNFGDTVITSAGSADIAVRINGRIMTPADASDAPFTIQRPQLTIFPYRLQFGLTPAGFSSDTLIQGYICNRSKVAVSFSLLNISGADSKDFQIIYPDSGFVLPGDSCVQAKIRFNPASGGNKKALITIGNSCVNVVGELEGTGISIGAAIAPLDWGKRRILTTNRLRTYLKNNSEIALTITSLFLQDQSVTSFKPILPALPLTISAGDSLPVDIDFIPADTISYTNAVLALAAQLKDTVSGYLYGEGALPLFRGENYNFAAVKTGTLSAEKGIIHAVNTTGTMPLRLSNAILDAPDADFTIESAGAFPALLSVNAADTHQIILRFQPRKSGLRTARIYYIHDAAPGPDPSPIAYDTVYITGTGLSQELQADTVLDFGIVNACDITSRQFTIQNPNNSAVVLNSVRIRGGQDTIMFSISYAVPFTLPAGASARINTQFAPIDTGSFTIFADLQDENGAVYTIRITGIARALPTTVQLIPQAGQSLRLKPGQNGVLNIQASFPASFIGKTLGKAAIALNWDAAVYSLADSLTETQQWRIDSLNNANGFALISGNNIQIQQNQLRLFSIPVNAYLQQDSKQPIQVQFLPGSACLLKSSFDLPTELIEVCFNNGRIVNGSGKSFYLKPDKNGIIHYGIGYTCAATLQIIDLQGKISTLIPAAWHEPGEYSTSIQNLSSGMYTVLLRMGPYTVSETLIIRN
jgi:hypothetical protein